MIAQALIHNLNPSIIEPIPSSFILITQQPTCIGMKLLQNYASLMEAIQKNRAILVIFCDPQMLTPSESLVKYFTFNPIASKLEDSIFIFKNVDLKVYEHFNVLQFPQVTVIKENPHNILYNFIGCNQEKSWEALCDLAVAVGRGKPYRKLNLQKKLCPQEHEMKFVNEIDETLYRNGCFMCNGCSMLSHVELDKPILHCQICEYDLCYLCSHEEVIN